MRLKGLQRESPSVVAEDLHQSVSLSELVLLLQRTDRRPPSTTVTATLRSVLLLCLPTLVGNAYFLFGVIASRLEDDPRVWTFRYAAVEHIVVVLSVVVYAACYLGVYLGPLLLPYAVFEAGVMTRRQGIRSVRAIGAWIFVVLAVVATASFVCDRCSCGLVDDLVSGQSRKSGRKR